MTVSEVRKRYLDFFAKRGHAIIPSAPIVPENDPTTLFTSSGMQPLVPYLLGQEHPEGKRLANSQLSFRAGDIEEVGDNRHTTFFEMLGNWSLGDYFKKEQLPWIYEFLTEELKLPKDRLWVTCFVGDESLGLPKDTESEEIWKKIGMPQERILFYDATKNWWSRSGTPDKMPAGEPGGPDSEIFYEFTSVQHDPAFGKECHPNCDCGRFMEIGNSVFMEYIKNASGSFGKLPKRNVDFGGGLERLTAATRNNSDVFLIDAFDAARTVLEKRSGKQYQVQGGTLNSGVQGSTLYSATRSFRIILDHMRAAVFIIASGVRPSNTEQGYVLRRLIRRSIREADKLGIKETVLAEVAESFGAAYRNHYPFIYKSAGRIREELEKEEQQFRKTLAQGMRELEKMGNSIDAFMLFTTYGFPVELTAEIAAERGQKVDMETVQKRIDEHQAKSRMGAAQKFAGGLADHAEQTVRYHTAHHLLLKALQMVLGPEVHQRGSNITSERLRIDFSYGQKMTPEQKAEVERIVNQKIAEGLPVVRTVMKKEEAEELGAEHEFGASYPEQVSVYSVGPLENAFSIEFCGGPHVANTAELGSVREPDGSDRRATFKILKEEASSAGVRRIKAVLE
ncbi:TPA: alanine--tRNA ligase [Candidatus Kaiserbacteria bacterium]|nr:alanine--tRNA ligase [Candidatus Kaiserbacteria bacterium]